MGTLIDPHWVVTAAHVVREVPPFDPNVVIAGKRYGIERVIMHPGWQSVEDMSAMSEVVDLALIRLRDPVTDVEPMLLYKDDDEVGREIIFVGTGMTGTGLAGPVSHDRKWRAATNAVEKARENWLHFRFSEPPNATDLEGISGPGDSGGPALIERDGRLVILGVSSYNDGSGADLCRYRRSIVIRVCSISVPEAVLTLFTHAAALIWPWDSFHTGPLLFIFFTSGGNRPLR